MQEEVGIEAPPVEGPIAIVESIGPKRSFVAKHVVHMIFAGDLTGSLESVNSQDEAVRGHRLFRLDELDGIVLHPPIQRFLRRWQPGDPGGVSRGAVDAVKEVLAAHRRLRRAVPVLAGRAAGRPQASIDELREALGGPLPGRGQRRRPR